MEATAHHCFCCALKIRLQLLGCSWQTLSFNNTLDSLLASRQHVVCADTCKELMCQLTKLLLLTFHAIKIKVTPYLLSLKVTDPSPTAIVYAHGPQVANCSTKCIVACVFAVWTQMQTRERRTEVKQKASHLFEADVQKH